MNLSTKKSVVCFGEILWDNLLDGKRPGGAPMNVAYHLHKLGLQSHLISSIGNDKPGKELLEFLNKIGIKTEWIQTDDQHETSQVLATISEENEVSYEIVAPVAWDYIRWEDEMEGLIKSSDTFVFGSLGSRNEASRSTLFKMLAHAQYKVFDVNLRIPHYSPELVSELLKCADMVKINATELHMISDWSGISYSRELDCIAAIFSKFGMKEILITKGSQGATYYTRNLIYQYPAYTISVADTIGSGDSFLAAFLAMKLAGEPLEVTLDYAVAMGAFITSQSGACPEYSKFDFDRFIWERKWFTSEISSL
ncbi:carbohydrate kinase [Sphingobacterium sp. SRCM116780]|uniref:carbohydrate kinase family protein n=1 Tax=Sphingobacterium sp. SRCM116780 TaxID=2907623 RepID=UPI001F3129D2|nr:carbohydrate kinase [Sphingobacterium sp. SRCM116780]UIR54682.1 carbohydrate kinase [Sphingobacterium sp. SRCM116780]